MNHIGESILEQVFACDCRDCLTKLRDQLVIRLRVLAAMHHASK